MTLVRYAGFDPAEGSAGYYPSVMSLRRNVHRERAYVMFKAGRDTLDIAQAMKVTEARVLEWITLERSRHRRLPDPYGDANGVE